MRCTQRYVAISCFAISIAHFDNFYLPIVRLFSFRSLFFATHSHPGTSINYTLFKCTYKSHSNRTKFSKEFSRCFRTDAVSTKITRMNSCLCLRNCLRLLFRVCSWAVCVCDLALFRVVLYTNKFISIWLFMIVLFGFIGMHIWIENCVHGSVIVWQFENMLYESYSSWHNNKLPPRTTHIYVYAYYANRANCFKSNILPFRLFRLSFVWYSLCSSHNFKLSQRKSMVRLLNCIESTFQSTNHRSWLVPIKIKLIPTIPN